MPEHITHSIPNFNEHDHLMVATPTGTTVINGVARLLLVCKCHCKPSIHYESGAIRVKHNFIKR